MPKEPRKETSPTSIIFPVEIHEALKVESVKRDLTVSQLVRWILRQWFEATRGKK